MPTIEDSLTNAVGYSNKQLQEISLLAKTKPPRFESEGQLLNAVGAAKGRRYPNLLFFGVDAPRQARLEEAWGQLGTMLDAAQARIRGDGYVQDAVYEKWFGSRTFFSKTS